MNLLNRALFYSGAILKKNPFLFKAFMQYRTDSLRIIYYHVVSDTRHRYYFDGKTINSDEFIYQIDMFQRHFEIISLTEALQFSSKGQSLRKKLVITFDDGFYENYSVIAPILIEKKLKATFYLIGNCIDNKDLMWRNKLLLINKTKDKVNLEKSIREISDEYGLKSGSSKNLMSWSFKVFPMDKKEEIVNKLWQLVLEIPIQEYLEEYKPYMTRHHIRELSTEGFEFGTHSMSHPIFNRLGYNNFRDEILNSRSFISQLTGGNVNTFSYPFGVRANADFEKQFVFENTNIIEAFLGTKNKLCNYNHNKMNWERDNLEFPFEIAISRFLLLSALRSIN